ncbi:hypothetical protein MKZ38_006623 [Zalerion maritima]|uniref:Uncharacterized protein n=1 Tax=Zalerion maritima TaxID=339359 RepID=A0AAD5RIQ3_9PEZI|nr:hypothetical protein MKZ38_006623 [Zalerion maritima]
MKLTPVKIPGKRWAPNDPNKPPPRDKRRKQPPSTTEAIVKNTKKHKKLMTLTAFSFRKNGKQHIPIDILEQIFLYSMNLNFPKVNHHLGFLLSGELTLIKTIQAAFGPTWKRYFQRLRGARLPMAADSSPNGDPKFQTAVLKAPWAKFPILHKAFLLWARDQKERTPKPAFTHGNWADAEEPYGVLKAHKNRTCTMDEPHGRFNADYLAFRESAAIEGEISVSPEEIRDPERESWEYACFIHPRTQIPDSLIAGPWKSWEQIHRLFWLLRMGANLDEIRLWEICMEGFFRIDCVRNQVARKILRALWSLIPKERRGIDNWGSPDTYRVDDAGPQGDDPFPLSEEEILGDKQGTV